MLERFTDRARRVVVMAQEARSFNHSYIGTEHLLLGLTREGDGYAARALESLGISLSAVRQQVLSRPETGQRHNQQPHFRDAERLRLKIARPGAADPLACYFAGAGWPIR
jgi:ATP-dependent Clp protease ATP-binding subunit ClpA